MPIKFVASYSVEMCRTRPNDLFVFGDNILHRGMGGQAIIRYEVNAVGLPTKFAPSMDDDAFFTDAFLQPLQGHIRTNVGRLTTALVAGGTVVWPQAGIGTGYARLHERAPAIAAFYFDLLFGFQKL